MDSQHPPYGISQPRQLVRWLDVNAQNGQLNRTQAFITIPPFSIGYTFNQVSDIIGAYWFLAPNAFSFNLEISPPIPNQVEFVLCVMWIDGNNNVYRYRLNSDTRALMPDIPLYTNELIKNKFRIEIWSCNVPRSNLVTQDSPIVLYTSVRGNSDYRYGVDQNLTQPKALETDFNTINGLNFPFVFANQLYINY